MPDPRPSIQLSTTLKTVKPPARFQQWVEQYGKTRMSAYLTLRCRAVEYFKDDPLGNPFTTKVLDAEILHCHWSTREAVLSELRSIGLIDWQQLNGRTIITVLKVPKTLPSSPLFKRPDAKPGDLIAEFIKRCREYTGQRPYIVRGKDYKIAARLLEQYTFATLKKLCWNYFEDVAKGTYDKGFSLGHFSTQINLLISKRGPLDGSKVVRDAVWYQEGRREILENRFKDKATKKKELAELDQQWRQDHPDKRPPKRKKP